MEEYILETKKLSFFYKGREKAALENIDIKIKRGVKTVLLGANGAGKSTLFYHFNGVYEPSTGLVYYDGKPMSYRRKALRKLRSEVAVVLQNPDDQIFCSTVEEDIAFGPKNMGLSEEEIGDRVDEALFQTGMTMLRKQGTLRLSYGQRKRLILAGAIAMRPKLLILDEPTAGLDPQMAHEIMELADQLHHMGTTVVISTHDVDLAYAWADEINVLRMSKLIYSGNSEEFYADPKLVHMAGLMPPSMYSINKNYAIMVSGKDMPYPRTLPELVSKVSKEKKVPGKLVIISVKDSLTEEDMGHAKDLAGDVRIGVYGTAARKAVFRGKLFSDYVFNGIDNCLIENVKGNNSILCCEDRMVGIVLDRLKRLDEFGCSVESEIIDLGN
ncbi:MAG: energy-coupling factor ABC transporter ATP-binding protein [Candidatus Methanogranum gryphiswaldense]|nr:MAG: energy-coupling factor ABC transporter ATP-binding protein [Candidatus Methanogranum sp. U3.2.1]